MPQTSISTREHVLARAQNNGARVTGTPDGTVPITIVFPLKAWQAFSDAFASEHLLHLEYQHEYRHAQDYAAIHIWASIHRHNGDPRWEYLGDFNGSPADQLT